MYDVGDIVLFYSNQAQKKKYHICLIKPSSEQAGLFLFLNSENHYNNSLALDCNRIPELAPTPSGQSYICCEQICCSELMLQVHVPKKICQLDTELCEQLLSFVDAAHFIERRIKLRLSDAITTLIEKRRPNSP